MIESHFVDRTFTEENHMRPSAIARSSVGRVLLVCRYGALCAAFCFFAAGLAPPVHAECNPNGTADEVIGCMDDANVAMKKQLTLYHLQYLQSLYAKCPSGGSGGQQDRYACLGKTLNDEFAIMGVQVKYYSRYLQSFDAKCQAEFSSGGSGGHQDRATCLQKKLKDEAARIGMPGK